MQSTLTREETDPHDIFLIDPDVVLAARVDKPSLDETSANLVQDILNRPSTPQLSVAPEISVAGPVPSVDTTFRATAATADSIKLPADIHLDGAPPSKGRWATRALIGFVFALASAAAAGGWDRYGDQARQMIADWTPSFVLSSLQTSEKSTAAPQAASPAVQATAVDPAPAQAASSQSAHSATPAATVAAPESTLPPQSMTQDIAAMGQQIEQLKASIAQLKAGQEQMAEQIAQQASRDTIRNAVARTSEGKASEPRPHLSAHPSRPAPQRKPRTAYSPAPAAAAVNLPPPPAVAVPMPPPQPAPYPQETREPDGAPVVRPPMPLR